MKDLRVIVVGAGIGGLSTALALATDGHEVTVLEGVKEFLQVTMRRHDLVPFDMKLSSRPGRRRNPRTS